MTELIHKLLQNTFFTGGFVLMVSGAILALCRSLPSQLWSFILKRVSVTATVRNSDLAFTYLLNWLNQLAYTRNSRDVEVSLAKDENEDDDDDDDDEEDGEVGKMPRFLFTPAEGQHV